MALGSFFVIMHHLGIAAIIPIHIGSFLLNRKLCCPLIMCQAEEALDSLLANMLLATLALVIVPGLAIDSHFVTLTIIAISRLALKYAILSSKQLPLILAFLIAFSI